MALIVDNYSSVKDLVLELGRLQTNAKAGGPPVKIAYCFMGGGARGAYHAGVLEGIQQEVAAFNRASAPTNQIALQPDILVGTSVGAIVAYAHWLDLVFPGGASAPYLTRQSTLWQGIATGNRAAEALLEPGV